MARSDRSCPRRLGHATDSRPAATHEEPEGGRDPAHREDQVQELCTHTRTGRSCAARARDPRGRRTGADSVRDLDNLLQTAGVPGPYLLVGFSFGGLLAIMYAGTYPDQVMGLVSLDGYLAARPLELPPTWPVERMRAFIRTKQVQFIRTVPNGRLVEVQSSHDIDLDRPDLVIQEVNRVLDSA